MKMSEAVPEASQPTPPSVPEPVAPVVSSDPPVDPPQAVTEVPVTSVGTTTETDTNPVTTESTDSHSQFDDPATSAVQASPMVDEKGVVSLPDGSKVYTRGHVFPIDNTEQAAYNLTHLGDQPRYSLKPGDFGYSSYSDPVVLNSHLARLVESEIASFADRITKDASAEISPIWNGLKEVYNGLLKQAVQTGAGTSQTLV